MHRLYTLAAALAVLGAAVAHTGSADAQAQKQQNQAGPPQPPRIILRDRDRFGPPPQPERRYYGPSPGVQAPMQRVQPPAPLAQPPINR